MLVALALACYLACMRRPKDDQDPLARLEAGKEQWRKQDLAGSIVKIPLRRAEYDSSMAASPYNAQWPDDDRCSPPTPIATKSSNRS